MNLPNFKARVKRIHGGTPTEAEYFATLPLIPAHAGRFPALLSYTRNRNARLRRAN